MKQIVLEIVQKPDPRTIIWGNSTSLLMIDENATITIKGEYVNWVLQARDLVGMRPVNRDRPERSDLCTSELFGE